MITELLDDDFYETYLKDLGELKIELYCKNHPTHLEEGVQLYKLLVKGLPKFLTDSFTKPLNIRQKQLETVSSAQIFNFRNLTAKSMVPLKVASNCIAFEFKTTQISLGSVLPENLPSNFKESKLFYKYCLVLIASYPNQGKIDFNELEKKCRELEIELQPTFDLIIDTLTNYIIYFDYVTSQFAFELKD